MTVTRTKCDPVGRPACAAVRLIADVLLSANLIKKLCRQSHIDDSRTPSALMQLTNELVNSIRLFCLKARGTENSIRQRVNVSTQVISSMSHDRRNRSSLGRCSHSEVS